MRPVRPLSVETRPASQDGRRFRPPAGLLGDGTRIAQYGSRQRQEQRSEQRRRRLHGSPRRKISCQRRGRTTMAALPGRTPRQEHGRQHLEGTGAEHSAPEIRAGPERATVDRLVAHGHARPAPAGFAECRRFAPDGRQLQPPSGLTLPERSAGPSAKSRMPIAGALKIAAICATWWRMAGGPWLASGDDQRSERVRIACALAPAQATSHAAIALGRPSCRIDLRAAGHRPCPEMRHG